MGISGHILQQPDFWSAFVEEVEIKQSWNCPALRGCITETFHKDAMLYPDEVIFSKRRNGVLNLCKNHSAWTTTVLGACKELAAGEEGKHSRKLKDLYVLETLKDYVDHLDYFYKVAFIMDSKCGDSVLLDLKTTFIHDLDKLDPAMLVAYSERFDDDQTTDLWLTCVDHHTRSNPHHQAHPIWGDNCICAKKSSPKLESCLDCDQFRLLALREMVCDKVSRRLQKVLDGEISDQMYDVDMKFYNGLSRHWLTKAVELVEFMKE